MGVLRQEVETLYILMRKSCILYFTDLQNAVGILKIGINVYSKDTELDSEGEQGKNNIF
jgi:hypothetical protein